MGWVGLARIGQKNPRTKSIQASEPGGMAYDRTGCTGWKMVYGTPSVEAGHKRVTDMVTGCTQRSDRHSQLVEGV